MLAMALRRLGETAMVLVREPAAVGEAERREMEAAFGLRAVLSPGGGAAGSRWGRVKHNALGAAARYRERPELVAGLAAVAEDFRPDVLVSRQLHVGRITGLTGLASRLGAASALDVDDLDWRVYASRLEHGGDRGVAAWVVRRHLGQLKRAVPGWLEGFDHLWVASDADRGLVEHGSVSVLPNIPYTGGEPMPEPPGPVLGGGDPELLLVASLNHGPNVRGVERFLGSVWPGVLSAVSGARLRLVGGRMSEEHKRRWSAEPGVVATGYVADLREAYAGATAAVSPVYEGGGTKIKVLEALMFGRPIAVTEHSYYGYASMLPEGAAVEVGRSDAELVGACVRLLNDPARSAEMGRVGYGLVREHAGFEAFAAAVRAGVERAVSDRSGVLDG